MADLDLLNQVADAQGPSNQDVLDVVNHNQWANTFQNTPPAEVLRSRVDLADTINRAFDHKLALQARSDAGALNLMQKNAQYQEYLKQAPMREQLLQARIDATGATERRRAAEALSQASDTTGLNNDLAQAYASGLKPGSPDFQQAIFSSIAAHPHAAATHIQEAHKLAGGPDNVDPVQFAMEGKAYKDALVSQGFQNPRVRFVGGRWTGEETAPVKTDAERLAYETQKAQAIQDIHDKSKTTQSPQDKIATTEDLMVNTPISLSFGHLDDKGKLVPDTQGGTATHVNVSFVGPSGKIHDSGPITIDEYQRLQQRVKARGAAPAATPAPGAPVTPAPAASGGNIPTLSDKAQFDALPSGAQYIRNGTLYRKP